MTFHPDQLPDLSGKVYIVTGSTAGIGKYTAARLAEHGAHVYLCARSEARAEEAIKFIRNMYPHANLSYLIFDHTSLSSVVQATKTFQSKETVLHGLVNNGGIMATPYKLTPDGYEEHWQINQIAHWLLTRLLLPTMLETSKTLPAGSVRLVNVSSGGHLQAPSPGIDFSDLTLKNSSPINRYGQSKLANILHAKTIHQLHGPSPDRKKETHGEIWTSALQPGVVESELDGRATEMPLVMRIATPIISFFGGRWPTDKGAWSNLFLVASPEMKAEQSGGNFERIAKKAWLESKKSKDMELAAELERWTETEMKKRGFLNEA